MPLILVMVCRSFRIDMSVRALIDISQQRTGSKERWALLSVPGGGGGSNRGPPFRMRAQQGHSTPALPKFLPMSVKYVDATPDYVYHAGDTHA